MDQPMSNLKNRVALVTGSARGIGKAIAERFGALGASVVVNYAASVGPAGETVAAITRVGGTAMAVQADVAKVADIDRLFATTLERYGRVDIVRNTSPAIGQPLSAVSTCSSAVAGPPDLGEIPCRPRQNSSP